MNGSRRVRAASVLPRYGPPSLFKGHLSTKSNAFCTDSSSLRLSTLHLVENHMAVHYNKILSAKAMVDCSVPLSMSTSIKYADQQRREKLKKEIARCEREWKLTKTEVQANSKNNSKSFFNTLQKPSGESQNEDDVLIEEVNGYSSFARSPGTSKSNKVLTSGAEKSSSPFLSSVGYTAAPRRLRSGTSSGRRPRSTFPDSHQFRLVILKASSGDLLDKHSELFSNRHLPFTPRTLKTEAKSYLSQYRYYTPARRRKAVTDQRIEAETQTELSSFKSDFEAVETKNFTDSEVDIKQASCTIYDTKEKIIPLPLQGRGLPWDEIKDNTSQYSPPRAVSQYSRKPPPRRKIYSDKEELLYLSFIEDITDEILELGLFSNRFLEQLFERHIRQNKHHLEERKMRHLLHILKVNLGCISKENSVKPDEADMLNLPDFETAKHSKQSEYKNEQAGGIQNECQEYQKTLDMLLSAPKDENEIFSPDEFFLPVCKSKYSEGVIIQHINDETNLRPSIWDEKNPSISENLPDQETSVNVTEGDGDTEKVETANELCCLSTAVSPSVQLCSVRGDDNHDVERPTLKIMEMSIED